MNTNALFLALAIAVAPLPAFADDPSPAPAAPQLTQTQRDALHAAMKSYRDKSEALHQQARTQILGALTPANKTLLGSVVSQLAVAPQPDPRAAAAQLDAALSPGEQQAILAAAASLRDGEKALRDQMRAQMASTMPAMPNRPPGGGNGNRPGRSGATAPDAGFILLMTAMGPAGGGHMGMMGWGGPPMPHHTP